MLQYYLTICNCLLPAEKYYWLQGEKTLKRNKKRQVLASFPSSVVVIVVSIAADGTIRIAAVATLLGGGTAAAAATYRLRRCRQHHQRCHHLHHHCRCLSFPTEQPLSSLGAGLRAVCTGGESGHNCQLLAGTPTCLIVVLGGCSPKALYIIKYHCSSYLNTIVWHYDSAQITCRDCTKYLILWFFSTTLNRG